MSFTDIDLSKLPAPTIVEEISAETILAARKAELSKRHPAVTEALRLESEPLVKQLEESAYREVMLRSRVNHTAYAVMLAHSSGDDLDNLAALIPLERRVISEGNLEANPPVLPTYESDEEFRSRIRQAPLAYSVAGPRGAYIHHARAADSDVKDVDATSPEPSEVTVVVLSRTGNGTPSAGTIANVTAALNDEEVKPLGDRLTIEAATIHDYTVVATVEVASGPDIATVEAAINEAVQLYADAQHKIGASIHLPAIHKALVQEGVTKVTLTAPTEDFEGVAGTAPFMTSTTITVNQV